MKRSNRARGAALLAAGMVTFIGARPGIARRIRPGSPAAVSPGPVLPLSDPQNHGRWTRYEPLSDEFEGRALDQRKWWPKNPEWQGREPGFFSPENVFVGGGALHLAMRREEPPESARRAGYRAYTCAAVQSKGTVLYGYFEV